MRPRANRPDRPYYGSKQQRRRLFLLVGAFSIVVIGAQLVRDAKLWRAFDSRPESNPERKIDFGVRFEDESNLDPDEFRSKPDVSKRRSLRDGAAIAEIPGEDLPDDLIASNAKTPSTETTVDRSWLTEVRDNTLGIRHDESDAFFGILEKARTTPQSYLEADSTGLAAFQVLMIDSDSFRGRLVTVEGELRRLLPFEAANNEFGLKTLYEAWIRADDSPRNPYRVVFTSRPDGLPEGEQIEKPVRVKVTGYFFKRESYASVGGLHTAPLILARRLKRASLSPYPGPAPPPPFLGKVVLGTLIVAAAGFAFMVWRIASADRKFHASQTRRLTSPGPDPGAEVLKDLVLVDPGEMLRQLAEEEQQRLAWSDDEETDEPEDSESSTQAESVAPENDPFESDSDGPRAQPER